MKKGKKELVEARKKLALKRQKFCENYVIDGNGTKSALAAGFSKNTAAQQASNLLKMDDVMNYIHLLREIQRHRTSSDADKVVEELAKIGYSNIKNYYKKDGTLKDIIELDDDIAASILSVKETEFKVDDSTKIVREYKLHDKLSALKELGQHHDIYKKDISDTPTKVEIGIKINRGKK